MPTFHSPAYTLQLDRDAIIAALRAETLRGAIVMLHASCFLQPVWVSTYWEGDRATGSVQWLDGGGGSGAFAWSADGMVALGYEQGFGPVQQFGLAPSAITRGAADVRAAVPRLPASLEVVFARAVGRLIGGKDGEPLAGTGLWFTDELVGGSAIDDTLRPPPGRELGAARSLLLWGNPEEVATLATGTSSNGPALFIHRERGPEKQRADKAIESILARLGDVMIDLTREEVDAIMACGVGPRDPEVARQVFEGIGVRWPAQD